MGCLLDNYQHYSAHYIQFDSINMYWTPNSPHGDKSSHNNYNNNHDNNNMSNYHLLRTHFMSGMMLSFLYGLSHLILITTLESCINIPIKKGIPRDIKSLVYGHTLSKDRTYVLSQDLEPEPKTT